MDDFLQKLKKVVRIVLYGPAISQSDCRKAGPYQLPFNNNDLLTGLLGPYWEIRSPMSFLRPELTRAARKIEGFIFLVRTE